MKIKIIKNLFIFMACGADRANSSASSGVLGVVEIIDDDKDAIPDICY